MFDIIYALIFGVVFYFILKWLNDNDKVNTRKSNLTLEQQGVLAALLFYLLNVIF